MNFTEIMKQNKGYFLKHTDVQSKLQQKAKELCWKYNQTGPSEEEKRSSILKELLGTYNPLTFIEPSFHCDYGLNYLKEVVERLNLPKLGRYFTKK